VPESSRVLGEGGVEDVLALLGHFVVGAGVNAAGVEVAKAGAVVDVVVPVNEIAHRSPGVVDGSAP